MAAFTYADYLTREATSDTRHEYSRGAIRSIPQATPDHASLAAIVLTSLAQQLPAGCRAFACNLRIRIPPKNLATYADGAVVRGATDRAADDQSAITNPLLLVEVTSPSTEAYDRNAKLDSYRTIASLREVLIVSHREPRLTVHRRTPSGWTVDEARAGGSIRLESIDATLNVDDVYRDPLEDLR